MKPWTRDDTHQWVVQLENRLEDIGYYLRRTLEWCEENYVYDDKIVFSCTVMTAVWVSHMRNEPISKMELFEILGVSDWDKTEDAIFEFNSEYEHLDHEELLKIIVDSF